MARLRMQRGQTVKTLSAQIPIELHHELRVEALKRGISLTELVTQELDRVLRGGVSAELESDRLLPKGSAK